jgi:hypothetical protein
MKIINRELFQPAHVITIVLIVALAKWVAHHTFLKHVVDERKRPRFGKAGGNGPPVDESE